MSKNNQKSLSGTGLAVSTAPVWESMTNFNGTSLLASGVTNYLNSYNTSQVMRVKYGTAYLVTLRGMQQHHRSQAQVQLRGDSQD